MIQFNYNLNQTIILSACSKFSVVLKHKLHIILSIKPIYGNYRVIFVIKR